MAPARRSARTGGKSRCRGSAVCGSTSAEPTRRRRDGRPHLAGARPGAGPRDECRFAVTVPNDSGDLPSSLGLQCHEPSVMFVQKAAAANPGADGRQGMDGSTREAHRRRVEPIARGGQDTRKIRPTDDPTSLAERDSDQGPRPPNPWVRWAGKDPTSSQGALARRAGRPFEGGIADRARGCSFLGAD